MDIVAWLDRRVCNGFKSNRTGGTKLWIRKLERYIGNDRMHTQNRMSLAIRHFVDLLTLDKLQRRWGPSKDVSPGADTVQNSLHNERCMVSVIQPAQSFYESQQSSLLRLSQRFIKQLRKDISEQLVVQKGSLIVTVLSQITDVWFQLLINDILVFR